MGMIGTLALMQSVATGQAQTVNPATTVLQQNAQRLDDLTATTPLTGPVVISPEAARGQIVPPGGPTVLLNTVEFAPPSAFLTQADLDTVLVNYIGKRVDFSQIQQLVQDINDLYTRKGIVTASAVLPPQTLNNGVLKVQLVEGKLASVAVTGGHQVPDDFVLGRVRLTRGDNVVDVPAAAKDITYFNNVYDAQLRMSLQPGKGFGTTDVALQLIEPQKNQLSFFIDNQGVPSTGKTEAGVFYHRYGLLTTDDNFLAYGTYSEGSTSGTLSYDAPITPVGTRLGVTYSRSSIDVISGPSEPLNISGRSQSAGVTLTQPLHVSPNWSFFVIGGASYGTSKSFSNTTPLVDSTTRKYSLALNANYSSQKFAFSITPQISQAVAKDHLEPSKRNINLFTGSFNGSYQLGNGVVLTTNGAWQYTNTKLLPGDLLFQVGGPTTVRGFPSDASAGDSGYFAQFEAHKSLTFKEGGKGIDVYGFIDAGAVYSTFPERLFFLSGGAGVAYPLSNRVNLEVGVGIPLKKVVENQSSATVYARLTAIAF
jgi:hemolysin activation/secretion protein